MKTPEKSKKQFNAGFTLVEILAALFLLSMALTAALGLFSTNAGAANLIKNSFIASGLVQEGVEIVKNLRDSDWHADRPFGSFGNPGGLMADGGYRVQWNSNQLLPTQDVFLKRNMASGIFSYDSGANVIFKRTVTISTVAAYQKRVTVTVSWSQKNIAKSVSAEDHIFNWR